MTRAAKQLAILVGLLGVVWIGSALAIRWAFTGPRLQRVVQGLEDSLALRLEVRRAEFDISSWLRFEPRLTLHDVQVRGWGSPQSPALFVAQRIFVQLSLLPLLRREVRIRAISVDNPRMILAWQPRGPGLETVLGSQPGRQKPARVIRPAPAPHGLTVRIDVVEMRRGILEYPKGPGRVAEIHLGQVRLTDLATRQVVPIRASGFIGDQRVAEFTLEGWWDRRPQASRRLEGRLEGAVYLERMPQAARQQIFYRWPGSYPTAGVVRFLAEVSGDVEQGFQLRGRAQIHNGCVVFQNGRRALLSGTLPFEIAVIHPLREPSLRVNVRGAALSVGKGNWRGEVAASYDGQRWQGASSGTLESPAVDEWFGAVVNSKPLFSGQLRVPSYRLTFSGASAAELRESLAGSGHVEILDGQINVPVAFKVVSRPSRRLDYPTQLGKGVLSKFSLLAFDFELARGEWRLTKLRLHTALARITGAGMVNARKQLDFRLNASFPALGPLGSAMPAQAFSIPLRVRGTVTKPQVNVEWKGSRTRRSAGL